jgi:cytochrome c551/c552
MIEDKDDTSKVKDLNNLMVSADYVMQSGKAALGHQQLSETLAGKNKMLTLDCASCHKVDEKSVGPSFRSVSQRYQKDSKAPDYLAQKIIEGGSGAWGPVPMAAHPGLKKEDAKQIVSWILSLDQKQKSLPAKGTLNATLNKPVKDNGILYIAAAYTDKGGNNIKPLMGSNSFTLRNSKVTFDNISSMQAFKKASLDDVTYMVVPNASGWFKIDSIDMTGIAQSALTLAWQKAPVAACTFEIHVDAPDGNRIGEFSFAGKAESSSAKSENQPETVILKSDLKQISDGKLHNVFIVKTGNTQSANVIGVSAIQFFIK